MDDWKWTPKYVKEHSKTLREAAKCSWEKWDWLANVHDLLSLKNSPDYYMRGCNCGLCVYNRDGDCGSCFLSVYDFDSGDFICADEYYEARSQMGVTEKLTKAAAAMRDHIIAKFKEREADNGV